MSEAIENPVFRLFLIIPFLLCVSCNNNDPKPESSSNTWAKTLSGSGSGTQILQTPDNGFIIIGGNRVLKLDEYGVEDWSTNLKGKPKSIIPIDDQDFLIVGNDYTFPSVWLWISRLDESGIIEWEKTFQTDQGDYGFGITASQNGNVGFTIVGSTNFGYDLPTYEEEKKKLWVLEIDGEGTLMDESFLIAGELPKYYFNHVLIPEDRSGFVIEGYTNYPEGSNYQILFKLNNDGNLLWDYSVEPTYHSIRSITEDSDGGYVFAGSTQIRGWVLKFNQNGSLLWEHKYGNGNRKHWAHSIAVERDGYILAGFNNANESVREDVWIFKLDNSGNLLWESTYGYDGAEEGNSIISTSDNGYALTGFTVDSGGYMRILALKLNELGLM